MKGMINLGVNGRRSGGFSLRKALENQGVTTEEQLREHLANVADSLNIRRDMDIARYRASPSDKGH